MLDEYYSETIGWQLEYQNRKWTTGSTASSRQQRRRCRIGGIDEPKVYREDVRVCFPSFPKIERSGQAQASPSCLCVAQTPDCGLVASGGCTAKPQEKACNMQQRGARCARIQNTAEVGDAKIGARIVHDKPHGDFGRGGEDSSTGAVDWPAGLKATID